MCQLPVISTHRRSTGRRLPAWLKRPLPGGDFARTRAIIADSGVATVCQEARCPNLNECWSRRSATFMILGDKCTRRCAYCAVTTARPDPPADDEPRRLARAVQRLNLRHVVITAVARDDLPDEGAGHFAACVRAVRGACADAAIEVLPADLHARAELLRTLCEAGPDIYNHNIETVERLTPLVRRQGCYRRSLDVLAQIKGIAGGTITKSGLMIGFGESSEEVIRTLADLRAVGCDVLTIGQYLQPSAQHVPVARYYRPEEFDAWGTRARAMGFLSVASGPFVRSSYNAAKVYDQVRRRAVTECSVAP